MEFFQGFTVTWAAEGPVADLTEQAVRAGWGFIGQVPPAVEQFNAVHSGDGLRQQWLFNQIKGVTDAAGLTLTSGDTGTLWQAVNQKFNLGFTPVQQGGGEGQGSNKVYIGWAGSTLQAQVDSINLGSFVFAARQFTAGEGLTGGGTFGADRVLSMGAPSSVTASSQNAAGGTTHTHAFDVSLQEMAGVLPVAKGGTGATAPGGARTNLGLGSFVAAASQLLSGNGYFEFLSDDGNSHLILQWGSAQVPGDGQLAVSWPKPFPNVCLGAIACLGGTFSPTADAGCSIFNLQASGATLMHGVADPTIVRYFAIGH